MIRITWSTSAKYQVFGVFPLPSANGRICTPSGMIRLFESTCCGVIPVESMMRCWYSPLESTPNWPSQVIACVTLPPVLAVDVEDVAGLEQIHQPLIRIAPGGGRKGLDVDPVVDAARGTVGVRGQCDVVLAPSGGVWPL